MSADVINLPLLPGKRRQQKGEPPPRPLDNAVELGLLLASSAEAHLDRYLKKGKKRHLKGVRFCQRYAISELRRAIEAWKAGEGGGDGDSAA